MNFSVRRIVALIIERALTMMVKKAALFENKLPRQNIYTSTR